MKKIKQKVISMTEYSKKMDAIIKRGFPVAETLIELLQEASKYEIKTKQKEKNV